MEPTENNAEEPEKETSRAKKNCKVAGCVFFWLSVLFFVCSVCFFLSTSIGTDFALFVILMIAVLGWFTIYPTLLFSLLSAVLLSVTLKQNRFFFALSVVIFLATLTFFVTMICLI